MKRKIQTYSKKELAKFYNVSGKTFQSWLKNIVDLNTGNRRIFTPKEVLIIFDQLGEPET